MTVLTISSSKKKRKGTEYELGMFMTRIASLLKISRQLRSKPVKKKASSDCAVASTPASASTAQQREFLKMRTLCHTLVKVKERKKKN